MRFDIWRVAGLALIVLLSMTIWYLSQVAESARRNVALLTEERRAMEKTLSDLAAEKKNIEAEKKNIETENKNIEAEKNNIEAELSRIKNEIEAKIADYENRLQAMADEMAGKDAEVARKNEEIGTLKKDIETYALRIEELDKKLSENPISFDEAAEEEAVTLRPLVITATGKNDNVKVLEVNKDYGFIVINAGSEYGIKKDDVLFVFRNKKMLGRVVVERVGEGVAIAKILYRELAHTVKEGDFISY